jgi:hypothetical protein
MKHNVIPIQKYFTYENKTRIYGKKPRRKERRNKKLQLKKYSIAKSYNLLKKNNVYIIPYVVMSVLLILITINT